MPTDTPADLRARAGALRNAAALLPGWEIGNLVGRAGPDSWVGPSPSACLEALVQLRLDLTAARDGLLATARQLEHRADAAEAAAHPVVVRT